MATLTCDICDGKLIIGAGGVASCENCGMEHSKARLQEKVRETRSTNAVPVSPTVSVMTTSSPPATETLFALAQNAKTAGNNQEAELYANRVLEMDPTDWKAWLIKGSAAGWQSTLANIRVHETAQCFTNSLLNAPTYEYDSTQLVIKDEFEKLSLAIIQLRANHFIKFPPFEKNDFISNVNEVVSAITAFNAATQIDTPNLLNDIATILNLACVEAWKNKIVPDYRGDDDRPLKFQFDNFIEYTDYCIGIIAFGINLKELNMSDIDRYQNIIAMETSCCEASSTTKEFNQFGSYFKKDYSLTENAVNIRNNSIARHKQTIQQIRDGEENKKVALALAEESKKVALALAAEQFRVAQNTQFWILHAREKTALEQENMRLNDLLAQSIKDFTRKEQMYIERRIDRIRRLLFNIYKLNDKLPDAVNEILDSLVEWNEGHLKLRSSDLATTTQRIAERDALHKQIAEQDAIITQNKGFFGEPARIRKAAQQAKAALQSQLATYSDLS